MESLGRYEIVDDATYRADDAALAGLLRRVYVGGGFTEASVAELVFKTEAVRARGQVLCARDVDGTLLGMVIVVPPTSPARVLAGPNEAEMHLLAVDEASRGHGLGRALVRAALDAAQASQWV